jgi:alkyl sulfatase BDS1-like metallo-beta-lactamase superfamily hydrolase
MQIYVKCARVSNKVFFMHIGSGRVCPYGRARFTPGWQPDKLQPHQLHVRTPNMKFTVLICAILASAAAQNPNVFPPRKPATQFTKDANMKMKQGLDWNNKDDFENAKRGLIAQIPYPGKIVGPKNTTVWDLSTYDFITSNNTLDDAPDTVNPSLWRNAKLNMQHGLFELAPGLYQLRGYDLATMTVIKSSTGYIVIDPLTTVEAVDAVWKQLVVPNLGDLPIKWVVYTHSHSDHIGGTRALVTDEQVNSGQVKILAPANFIEAAVGENVIAGNAMTRRATYHVGTLLQRKADGQIDGGLGKALSAGTGTLMLPTDYVTKTGEKRDLDGVEFEFIMAPESEAPSEFMFYVTKYKAFCTAEDAVRIPHWSRARLSSKAALS